MVTPGSPSVSNPTQLSMHALNLSACQVYKKNYVNNKHSGSVFIEIPKKNEIKHDKMLKTKAKTEQAV